MITEHNFEPGNAGVIFWTGISHPTDRLHLPLASAPLRDRRPLWRHRQRRSIRFGALITTPSDAETPSHPPQHCLEFVRINTVSLHKVPDDGVRKNFREGRLATAGAHSIIAKAAKTKSSKLRQVGPAPSPGWRPIKKWH